MAKVTSTSSEEVPVLTDRTVDAVGDFVDATENI